MRAWNSEGTILVAMRDQPLHWVSASGGDPAPRLWSGYVPRGNLAGRAQLSAGWKALRLRQLCTPKGAPCWHLWTARPAATWARPESPGYVPNPKGGGWLLYVTDGQLFARPLDPDKGQFTGEPVLVANAVGDLLGFSASTNGASRVPSYARQSVSTHLVRSPGHAVERARRTRQSEISEDFAGPEDGCVCPHRGAENADIWLLDLVRKQIGPVYLLIPGLDDYPVWSPDSSRIIFLSMRENERLLLERPADSTGSQTVLFKAPGDASVSFGLLFISKLPTSVSPDGRWVVASEWFAAGSIVWLIPRTGNGPPIRFTEGADGTVSPDGRWLLYATAGPDGRLGFASSRPEVFVEALPRDPAGSRSADRKWQISTAGGANPVWRGDGKEIFYLGLDGKMMSVPVESGANFLHAGTPKPLFQTRLVPGGIRQYDVTRDGKRFLLNVPSPDSGDEPITVIVNWPKLLER